MERHGSTLCESFKFENAQIQEVIVRPLFNIWQGLGALALVAWSSLRLLMLRKSKWAVYHMLYAKMSCGIKILYKRIFLILF